MDDRRIGKHGESEPKICAVTLQYCAGQHASHYSIGDGYYIAILEKAAKRMDSDDIEAVRNDCRKLVPGIKRAAKVEPMKKAEES